MIQLSPDALNALATANINNNYVRLTCSTLKDKVYAEVKTALTYLRGKWVGDSTQGFHFTYNPSRVIADVLKSGEMPVRNPLALYETPVEIADKILEYAEPFPGWSTGSPDWNILEPSAGMGAIAKRLWHRFTEETDVIYLRHIHLDLVEFDPINYDILCQIPFIENNGVAGKAEGYAKDAKIMEVAVFNQDFLTFRPEKLYDRIYMNPPFTVLGNNYAYMDHIQYAYSMLNDDGFIIAIAPVGFINNQDDKSKIFHNWVRSHGDYEELDRGAFKKSGTNTHTCIITLY